MRRRLLPIAMIGLMLAVLVLGLTYQRDNPREIVATGSVAVAGSRAGSSTASWAVKRPAHRSGANATVKCGVTIGRCRASGQK